MTGMAKCVSNLFRVKWLKKTYHQMMYPPIRKNLTHRPPTYCITSMPKVMLSYSLILSKKVGRIKRFSPKHKKSKSERV